jgi:hypothetical protein
VSKKPQEKSTSHAFGNGIISDNRLFTFTIHYRIMRGNAFSPHRHFKHYKTSYSWNNSFTSDSAPLSYNTANAEHTLFYCSFSSKLKRIFTRVNRMVGSCLKKKKNENRRNSAANLKLQIFGRKRDYLKSVLGV